MPPKPEDKICVHCGKVFTVGFDRGCEERDIFREDSDGDIEFDDYEQHETAEKYRHRVERDQYTEFEARQRAANKAGGRGKYTDTELKQQRAANKAGGRGEYTDAKVKQRAANKAGGRGEYTDAEVQQQCAANKAAGRGEYTDAEVEQRAANKAGGRGEYTDAEVEQRAANKAGGRGEYTDAEVKLQRAANKAGGRGYFTDAQLEMRANKARGNGAVTDLELERRANEQAGLGAVSSSQVHAKLAAVHPGEGLAAAASLFAGTDPAAATDAATLEAALGAWVPSAAVKIGAGDKQARGVVLQMLGHCYQFAAAPANAAAAAELYRSLTEPLAVRLAKLPGAAHAKAQREKLIGAGPALKTKKKPRWGGAAKAKPKQRAVHQADVSPFLAPEHAGAIRALAAKKKVALPELHAAMLLIVAVQVDQELDAVVSKLAAGHGELNGAPLKNMDRMLTKAGEKYKGDIGRGLDIARRSFTGKTPADHNAFAAPMIPEPAEPGEVVAWDGAESNLTAVRIKDGMDDPKATVKKMIINAVFRSSKTTYAELAKLASNRNPGSPFEVCRKANKAAFSLWSTAIAALSLPAFATEPIAQVVELQMYYPDFLAEKKNAHPLYKIVRAGSLEALAQDCAAFAVNKDLAYVALRDGGD